MRVRILRDLRTSGGRTFRTGALHDLADGDATVLIRRGVAVEQKPRKRRQASGKTSAANSGNK